MNNDKEVIVENNLVENNLNDKDNDYTSNVNYLDLIKNEQLDKLIDAIKYENEANRLAKFKNTIIIAISIILSPVVYLIISQFLK